MSQQSWLSGVNSACLHYQITQVYVWKRNPGIWKTIESLSRKVTEHTFSYRYPDAKPGEYTDTDMCAGDTICFSFSFLSSKYIYFTSSLTAYYLKIKHMECRLCIVRSYHIYVKGNVSTPLEKKTHFRHSNALYTNGYDASDRVKTNHDEFSIGKRWVTGHNSSFYGG